MNFTDIFIKRPVLAMVISLFFVVLGLRSMTSLPINQYPQSQSAVVTVATAYPGADAATIAGFITQPLEASIAQAQGIDYLSSSSSSSVSTITATLRLNYDADRALTQISTQVNAVKNQLPAAAQAPTITVATGQTTDAMYLGFYSDTLPTNDVTDYLVRVVVPQLNAVSGVQAAEVLGGRVFALRAWLDPDRMAGHGVTASEVSAALASNNYLAALGQSKGNMVTVPLTASTDLHSVDDFNKLVIKQNGASVVRLEDVATVVLGSQNYDLNVAFSGVRSVFIGIKVAPEANILNVAAGVTKAFPNITGQLPTGLTGKIVYDSTEFIKSSIYEVIKTLGEALLIVTVVIFLFLGSFRAIVVPLIAMPLSLIGTFFVMQLLGYSINLLTLLAMVLAIGLVVDDAIIVVENVDRHMKEEGKSPMQSALLAARELGGPILAMTTVLIAVYLPIGFQGGLTGTLFVEFAFSLAGAVTISGIVALTLSPMMCSRIFSPSQDSGWMARHIDAIFERVKHGYERLLGSLLQTYSVLIVMAGVLIVLLVAMFQMSQSELAPNEDQGIVVGIMTGPPTATADQMQIYSTQSYDVAKNVPEYSQMFQITGFPTAHGGFAGVILKPYAERTRSAAEVQGDLQAGWSKIAGANIAAFQFPPLPGASGLPVQFVITTTQPFQNLDGVVQAVLQKARADNKFYFVDSDLKIDLPQANLVVDNDKLASLGLSKQQVAAALGTALGGGYVNYFTIDGRAYQVIPQVLQVNRLNPSDVLDLYIPTSKGPVTVGTIAHLEHSVVPESISHFQQLNSATISGVAAGAQGATLDYLRQTLAEVAPTGFSADYAGQSRQYQQESGGFLITMALSVIIVFLALSALFESFRDPIVILISVPLALFGAVVFIFLGFSTINIYTEVGIVTLMGLISKHGILIVEFANAARAEGMSKLEAIQHAAATRLRPILMTTAAMVFGVVPLVVAGGAGAAGRHAMGLVIFTGMSIGTLFTLFVVPAMYLLLASRTYRAAGVVDEEAQQQPA
ncbi:efflux RND transporter permease subunit [Aestuariivirga litoralis]|uniref:efflux RND transporter permease subunit n=1 Tax=Aestuariivirga litoralis TaxID=2650924 RepID=UPI0018C77141|nr:efflux RND transporter permease subunit [Aestuariivirga litoralis]MBG1232503.1 multidrug efflux protein [Aestuariivirga litoralis]